MANPKTWIALLTAIALVWASLGDFGRNSPGPLSASHSGVPALQGSDSCAKCHGGWFGSMAEACLKCHTDIEAHLKEGRGLHGLLAKDKNSDSDHKVDAMNCAKCHTDHHGAEFSMVNRQSFTLAGIADVNAFDHEMIGYEMKGGHKDLACGRCHHHVDLDALGQGNKRFLGLSQNCGTCHDDPHKGGFGKTCTDCHNQKSFSDVYHVEHDKFLPLLGGHASLDCSTCHKAGTEHALKGLRESHKKKRTCLDCHESPHRPEFVKDTGCVDCHKPAHPKFASADEVLTPDQHGRTGFSLARPHEDVKCADCHKGSYLPFKQRYPGRTQDDCKSCHGDPHDKQFEGGLFTRRGCLTCHSRHEFKPHRFTNRMHTKAGFKLTGAHQKTDCHACHKQPQKDKARIFDQTPQSCQACHKDAHRGAFQGKAGSCRVCHTTNNFKEHRRPFAHFKWTGFALSGAHAQEECASCHKPRKRPDKTGRTFGRITKYKGCVTCHTDPHRGAFARQGFQDCADCHADVSFRVLPNDFDHGTATGFTLDGAHGKVDCSKCHPRLDRPDESGRTWKPARGQKCVDCHDDPHSDQFRVNGVNDCQRCHKSTMSFSELSFDHDKDTRFPLDKQHVSVACAGCHKPARTKQGQFVRYKPLGMKCVDCHKAQRDPLRRKGKR